MALPPVLSTGVCILRKRGRMLSAVDRVGINPDWSRCTSCPTTPASLLARTLSSSLTSILSSDMGRYESGICLSLPGLGRTTIMASFIESGRWPVLAASCRVRKSGGRRIDPYLVHTSTGSPSDLGDLWFGASAKALVSSSIVIGESSVSF